MASPHAKVSCHEGEGNRIARICGRSMAEVVACCNFAADGRFVMARITLTGRPGEDAGPGAMSSPGCSLISAGEGRH
ncbi:hypothetical protein [Acetobacter fallax]|uniref:Uncharacterized protein n=1 Tax=Acetobacter fallax TaxID=1737473 RepID=A0ABX0KGD7_9PROT|nr:hypothetical protein [Acetobacter fallax]NHO32987.1 hypothetical protein [Acetobacter fallax]NHO36644.1 hypothetical protein [Acetobacter fallax]